METIDPEAIDNQALEVSITSEESRKVVTVKGDLDLSTVKPLRQWIADLDGDLSEGEIIIDLSGVRFLDVVGYHGLVRMTEPSHLNGGRPVVFRATPQVARLFDLVIKAGYQPPFEIIHHHE